MRPKYEDIELPTELHDAMITAIKTGEEAEYLTPAGVTILIDENDWARYGNCGFRNAEEKKVFGVWEYGGKKVRNVKAAREICKHCGVYQECLEYALKKPDDGMSFNEVWAGTTGEQRVQLRLQRQETVAAEAGAESN